MCPRAAMYPKATVGSKEMAARSIAGIENLAVRKNWNACSYETSTRCMFSAGVWPAYTCAARSAP